MNELFTKLVPTATRVAAIGLPEDGSELLPVTESITQLTDIGLSSAMHDATDLCRAAQAVSALLASEVARRSRPELGYAGLAQAAGHRTPELMVQAITGTPYREAARLISVGTMVANSDVSPEPGDTVATPALWSDPITTAVKAGALSVVAADAIMRGLGEPNDRVPDEALHTAAAVLVAESARIGVDNLFRRARQLRDQLDAAGVAEREDDRRRQRYLKIGPELDGMRRIHGLLDPESAGVIVAAFDAVTSPRRGGPRFVDPADKARAEAIVADPRTTEQVTLDALVDMVRIAIDADPGTIFGHHRPAVRMIVTAEDLRTSAETQLSGGDDNDSDRANDGDGAGGTTTDRGRDKDIDRGFGIIEGQPDAVSLHTIHRAICDTGIIPIMVSDKGQPLDVGLQQRLFTSRQRIALAARDGGCLFPDCDRPPSWCEAHHINPWQEGGRTDVRDGVLTCRHHHMLMHNNGWRIIREDSVYWLKPPRSQDPKQTLIRLHGKSPLATRWATRHRERAS